MSLFEPAPLSAAPNDRRPLADRMRPETLEEFVGQAHMLGPGKPLRQQIERDELASMILWARPARERRRSRPSRRAERRATSSSSAPSYPGFGKLRT